MTLKELRRREAELWEQLQEHEAIIKPIRQEWNRLYDELREAELREKIMEEMKATWKGADQLPETVTP